MTPLVWVCDVCSVPVADGAGYLCVDYAHLHRHEREARAWEEFYGGRLIPVSDLMLYPDAVEWRTLHRACDPDLEAAAYWIGVERLRDYAALLDWTAHLMGKRWLLCTDWADVLRRAAEPRFADEYPNEENLCTAVQRFGFPRGAA